MKVNVKAILWDSTGKDGRRPVKIRVIKKRQVKYRNLGKYVFPEDWNEDLGLVLPKHKNGKINRDASDINATIQADLSGIKAYNRIRPLSTVEELVRYDEYLQPADPGNATELKPASLTFWEWVDDFMERAERHEILIIKGPRKGKPLSRNTVLSFKGSINNLRLFDQRKTIVDWHTIDKDLYDKLVHFLRFELKTNESRTGGKVSDKFNRPRHDSTIGKDIKNFKSLIGWSIRDLKSDKYRNRFSRVEIHGEDWFVVPEDDVKKYVPEPEERDAILFNLDLTNRPGLRPHQDRAIVAYYFLQRFGDSLSFDRSNFYHDKKLDTWFFHTRSEKTNTDVEVPVSPRLWEVLVRNNFEMPMMSNTKANEALKELGRLAAESCPSLNEMHIEYVTIEGERQKVKKPRWQSITTHTMRRLGATDMDEAGVPAWLIMMLGGWSTEQQMREYIDNGARRQRRKAREAAAHPFFKR